RRKEEEEKREQEEKLKMMQKSPEDKGRTSAYEHDPLLLLVQEQLVLRRLNKRR
ncbi:hypothetical protein A2U01_0054192, partial [Trifolium medium]|nr:hypothetical protein [Trifolium medium]